MCDPPIHEVTGPMTVRMRFLGNAFLIEVCHGAPECLELGAGIDTTVNSPIECIGITIIIDRFPISIIDNNPEDRCSQLIDQQIYGRPQFSILPAGTINIDPKAIDGSNAWEPSMISDPPAPAKAINESPMTIWKLRQSWQSWQLP